MPSLFTHWKHKSILYEFLSALQMSIDGYTFTWDSWMIWLLSIQHGLGHLIHRPHPDPPPHHYIYHSVSADTSLQETRILFPLHLWVIMYLLQSLLSHSSPVTNVKNLWTQPAYLTFNIPVTRSTFSPYINLFFLLCSKSSGTGHHPPFSLLMVGVLKVPLLSFILQMMLMLLHSWHFMEPHCQLLSHCISIQACTSLQFMHSSCL